MTLLLSASPNGRYLVDGNGNPFQLRADSDWGCALQLSQSDMLTLLDDRQARGFNSLIVETSSPDPEFSNAPHNANGDSPFTGTPFQSSINNAYWSQVDYLMTQAAARGIVVQFVIAYFGFGGGNEGWWADLVAAGATNVQSFAATIAARYTSFDNLIWVIGGDFFPPSATIPNALAAGILSADTRHLITAHWDRGSAGTRGSFSWLTLNSIYTSQTDVSSLAQAEYLATTSKPLVLIESDYFGSFSGQPTLTAKDVRTEAWQAYLSGVCGNNYGDHGIWPFASGWQSSLSDDGAKSIQSQNRVMAAIKWWTLVPDTSSQMVTAGRGTVGTTGYVCAATDSSHGIGLAFLPDATSAITVALSLFSGRVSATWVDPYNGNQYFDHTYANSGSHSFSRSTSNSNGGSDWLLLLQVPTMTTTPKRLFGPAALTTSAATKYTAPAGGAQIKRIRVDNPQGGSARAFTLSIGADAAGTRLFDALTVPAGGIDIWGPFTLGNGEIVQALADNVALVLTIDGVEYS